MAKVQLLTQAEYARHRGVSRNAVARAIKEGRIVLIDGRIDPAIADAQWQANTRPRSDARSPGGGDHADARGTFGTARTRRELAEASLAEIQLAEKRGELINRAGVEMALETCIRRLRDGVMSAPDRMALDHVTRAKVLDGLRAAFDDAIKTFGPLPGNTPSDEASAPA